ncbi:MAG TPA: hypothetical protein VF516_25795 [Kofleriaceae bacterium]
MSTPEAVLYCQGTFSAPNPTPAQMKQMMEAAKDIGNSGFSTVILGQFHVHSNGSIYYNDSPLDTVMWALETVPGLLKQAGKVQRVLVTFGPFASDFAAIQANLASFQATMAKVMAAGRIDGLDWDLEQNLSQFTTLLVQLTVWANSLGKLVTAAPYYDIPFWSTVLQQTQRAGGSFAWWNLQLYGGASYPQWARSFPAAFLYAGYANTQGATPGSIQSSLAALRTQFPSLTGGFLWRYESIAGSGYTTAQYAQGILAGVSDSETERIAVGA